MNTPVKGKKICLRGFGQQQESEVASRLVNYGFEVAASISCADALVVGPGDAALAVEAARKARLPVTPWTEFISALENVATPAPAAGLPRRAAVEIKTDSVRILDQELRRSNVASPLVPEEELFHHLCLDSCFLQNGRAVAIGIANRLPVMLEGETCTSKTISIRWVAHLRGHPVLRINLNGQSDTGELVGKFVPSGGIQEVGDPLVARERPNGKMGAHLVPRGVQPEHWSKWEPQSVGTPAGAPSWRFREGCIPAAMRRGYGVILDELNLGEPQVVERLNSALEQPPSLVLTEGDGTVFGPGGVPVSSGFQLFATMNPAEYVGRSVLSPAFRDRWFWHHAEVPGEADYLAMLNSLVFGEQPEFPFRGVLYYSPTTKPIHPELATIMGIRELLPRLAMFHFSMCQASGMGGAAPSLGRIRRERYVFTRRTLLNCLKLLGGARLANTEAPVGPQIRQAIEDAYFGRICDRADRNAAVALLRAAGLVENDI
jgi:hypothetical protein